MYNIQIISKKEANKRFNPPDNKKGKGDIIWHTRVDDKFI